ncbi:MAG: hypothetical protein ACTSRL_22285 [Candidatus Helarchaeota archaeon]
MTVLSVRLDPELEEKLHFIMAKRKIVDKSAYVRQLLSKSVTEDLLNYLCEEVKAHRISAWFAAKTAKISLRTMLKELACREISLYDDSSLAEDLMFALSE